MNILRFSCRRIAFHHFSNAEQNIDFLYNFLSQIIFIWNSETNSCISSHSIWTFHYISYGFYQSLIALSLPFQQNDISTFKFSLSQNFLNRLSVLKGSRSWTMALYFIVINNSKRRWNCTNKTINSLKWERNTIQYCHIFSHQSLGWFSINNALQNIVKLFPQSNK